MKIKMSDYFTLPIREKVRLFLNVSNKNQFLTDASGVNNSKISELKRKPEKISNIQLNNVEKIEEAYKEFVKSGLITFTDYHIVLRNGVFSKPNYLKRIIETIIKYKVNGQKVVPYDYKKFSARYRRNIGYNLTHHKPVYRLTVYNDLIDEIYRYQLVFIIRIDPYLYAEDRYTVNIDLKLTKIPKSIK